MVPSLVKLNRPKIRENVMYNKRKIGLWYVHGNQEIKFLILKRGTGTYGVILLIRYAI